MGTIINTLWSDDFVFTTQDPFTTGDDGWYIHSSTGSSFNSQNGAGTVTTADDTYNGPYSLYLTGTRNTIYVDRFFTCMDDDFTVSFDYCHCGMEPSDTFSLYYSEYVTDSWIEALSIKANTDGIGESVSTADRTALNLNDRCGSNYICSFQSFDLDRSSFGNLENYIKLQFRVSVNYYTDTFALRNFKASCTSPNDYVETNNNAYNPFTSVSTNNEFVFGFKSFGDSAYTEAPKATIVLDLYDTDGNIYRCRHIRAGTNTIYNCAFGVDDRVSKLSANSNPNNYRETLLLRVYEFDQLWIESFFITTAADSSDPNKIFEIRKLYGGDDIKVTKTKSWLRFKFDTSTSDICVIAAYHDDEYSINGIDNDYGLIIHDSSSQSNLNYDSSAADCNWKTSGLDAAIQDTVPAPDIAGTIFDGANTLGSVMAVFPAGMCSFCAMAGNGLMLLNNVYDFGTGVSAASPQEKVRAALNEMKESMGKVYDCSKQYTDYKIDALRNELSARINEVVIELNYKIHVENVEQEIAAIQDVLLIIKRQMQRVDKAKSISIDEQIAELSEILDVTMGRFGGVIKHVPEDYNKIDFFWKLYAKEMSIFVLETINLRFQIWALWIEFNNVKNTISSVKDITPDYHRSFRDLNGELIEEYIRMLPLAIYAIIDDSDDVTQLQQLKPTDRFAEIDLRFNSLQICRWIKLTKEWTETTDVDFLGDIGSEYNDDMALCESNICQHVIKRVVLIDHRKLYKSYEYNNAQFIVLDEYIHSSYLASVDTGGSQTLSISNGISALTVTVADVYGVRLIQNVDIEHPSSTVESGDVLTLSVEPDGHYVKIYKKTIACSSGYLLSAIRFGYAMRVGSSKDVQLEGFKILCRPTSTLKDDWCKTFTDYEVITTSFSESSVILYSEWYECPIGTLVTSIIIAYSREETGFGDDDQVIFTMDLKCGSVDNALKLTDFTAATHYFHIDVHDRLFQVSTLFGAVFCTILVIVCVFNTKKSMKYSKIEHFDQTADDDSETDV